MGFDYKPLMSVDKDKHKFIGGNHDNYDQYYGSPHIVGGRDYGMSYHGGLKFFFVRGGFSIDWKTRQNWYLAGGPKSYWDNEELTLEEMEGALAYYKHHKPEVMISHECPRSVAKLIGSPDILRQFGYDPDKFTTKTSELLQTMFESHQPKVWYFGHYHKDWSENINGTQFTCLNELGYVDIET